MLILPLGYTVSICSPSVRSSELLVSTQKQSKQRAQKLDERQRRLISRAGKFKFLAKAAAVLSVPSLLCLEAGWIAVTLGSHLALNAIAEDHVRKAAAMRP